MQSVLTEKTERHNEDQKKERKMWRDHDVFEDKKKTMS